MSSTKDPRGITGELHSELLIWIRGIRRLLKHFRNYVLLPISAFFASIYGSQFVIDHILNEQTFRWSLTVAQQRLGFFTCVTILVGVVLGWALTWLAGAIRVKYVVDVGACIVAGIITPHTAEAGHLDRRAWLV
jgi:hypothetical protein